MKLIATEKMGRYKTRHLVAGEEFEVAKERFGRLLIAIGKAKEAPAKSAPAVTSAPARPQSYSTTAFSSGGWSSDTHPDDPGELARLRERAKWLGVDIDGRWGLKRLQVEIDQHAPAKKFDHS